MSYGELYLQDSHFDGRNPLNGRFLKGHIPANKGRGREWFDSLKKSSRKRMMKGWKNLDLHRARGGNGSGGRKKKEIIAVLDDGNWRHFSYLGAAAQWCGGKRENVGRCCRQNMARAELLRPNGQPSGRTNTDHRYKGVRFYFESDDIWTEKIRRLG